MSTDEIKGLVREIHDFNNPPPELVITGGDPLCRPDLDEIVAYASELGVRPVLWLGPTGHLTQKRLERLKDAGARVIALSLDHAEPEGHDRTHAPGAYKRTIEGLEAARTAGLQIHINTLVSDETLADVPRVFEKVCELHADQWNLFFLVRMNSSQGLEPVSPLQAEVLLNWLFDASRTAPMPIEVMEAPQYRRIVFQRLREAGVSLNDIAKDPQAAHFGLRDGNGIVFVSHVGDVYPAPFLPVIAGNIRGRSLTSLYRRSPLFRELRDPSRLKGDCSRCEFRRICGGSRARAYAQNKDWTGPDPLCSYQPVGIQQAY